LKFASIDLEKIGKKCGLRDHQWAELTLRLTETENDHNPSVSIDVLVPMRPDATMCELEEAARTQAQAMLSASLGLLQGSSVAELRSREYDESDAAERARDEELQRQISEIGKPSR
jgi:hypothetical protein